MGDDKRAEHLSKQFNNKTLQAIALFAFKRCGNCTHRVECANEILGSGGNKAPIATIVYGMMQGCPKVKYDGIGVVPREVANYLNKGCNKCDKFEICMGYLGQAMAYDDANTAKLTDRMRTCTSCPDLGNCINYYMIQLKISKFKLIKSIMLQKFRKCSYENMITTSLDLSIDTPVNVKGKVNKGE